MTDAGVVPNQGPRFHGVPQEARTAKRGASALPALAVLAGLIFPPELGISTGVALTPGRMGILLFVLPALGSFLAGNRRRLLSDLFVVATACWIVGSAVYVSGTPSLWSAPGGESLEFLGAYFIARAYFFEPAGLEKFIRVLKTAAVIVIVVGILEFAAGRLILRETVSSLVGARSAMEGAIFRGGFIRAVATFEHPIPFGSFCSLLLIIVLYWERSTPKRILWAGICLAGAIASITSVALLSYFLGFGLYIYDQVMRHFRWRWKAIWITIMIIITTVFSVTNSPLGWIVTHLTFDPESGYFRYLIWDAATTYIDQAPWTGYAYNLLHNDILDTTVDSVWLVTSLRYGLPAIFFLFLANVTALLPTKAVRSPMVDPMVRRMSTAFSIVLILFMFDGLTVHFWNFLWIFWGVCIGTRASLRELALSQSSRSIGLSRHAAFQAH